MLEKRMDCALTDDEMDKVGGGIAADDLKRVKCPSCENIFMANTNVFPVICPDCGYTFEKEDLTASSKSGGVTVSRRGKKKKTDGQLVSGGKMGYIMKA